jgi:hypothetical protein
MKQSRKKIIKKTITIRRKRIKIKCDGLAVPGPIWLILVRSGQIWSDPVNSGQPGYQITCKAGSAFFT